MTLEQLRMALLPLLMECNLECQARLAPEELAALAASHAQAYLQAMERDRTATALRIAFLEHRRECRWFPRPADILPRLGPIRWRILRGRLRRPAMPARDETITPGFGHIISAAARRDLPEFRRLMAEYPEAAAKVRALPRLNLAPEVVGALAEMGARLDAEDEWRKYETETMEGGDAGGDMRGNVAAGE